MLWYHLTLDNDATCAVYAIDLLHAVIGYTAAECHAAAIDDLPPTLIVAVKLIGPTLDDPSLVHYIV